jgi:hypothetical protein
MNTLGMVKAVRLGVAQHGRHAMTGIFQFTTLAVATMFAAAAAVAFDWLLLRAAFHLMKPATTRRVSLRTDLVRGTIELARAFDPRR